MTHQITKIFMNGRSQAVRIPKEYHFNTDKVYITKQDDKVIISEKNPTWDDFFDSTSTVDDDFLSDRNDSEAQERDFD